MAKEPSNFSWVIENKIAASGFPFDQNGVLFFIEQGIKAIINLSGKSSEGAMSNQDQIKEYMVDIPDFGIPTVEQIREIWQIIGDHLSKNEALVIHCIAGCGRTGTILASILFHLGKLPTMRECIDFVRSIRPCSIETQEQENFLINSF